MNNAAGQRVGKIPLTVMGGAVTEMAPSDLPEGASPFNQDCDFLPGSVFTRGGRLSVYSFANLAIEDLAGGGLSLPGLFAPNEGPWTAPNNITVNSPPSYASVTLNAPQGGAAGATVDNVSPNSGTSGTAAASGTPSRAGEVAIYLQVNELTGGPPGGVVPAAGWSLIDNPDGSSVSSMFSSFLPSASPVSLTQSITASANWATLLAFFGSSNGLPVSVVQSVVIVSGAINGSNTSSNPLGSPVTAGNGIMVLVVAANTNSAATGVQVTDNKGNLYSLIGNIVQVGGSTLQMWWAPNAAAGSTTVTYKQTGGFYTGTTIKAYEMGGIGALNATPGVSQVLTAKNFNFNIPATDAITGLQVELFGHQTALSSDAVLSVNLALPTGVVSTRVLSGQLPAADGEIVIGAGNELWNSVLTPAVLNNPNFTVQIVAQAPGGELASFLLYAVKVKAFVAPSPPQNFNYVKTYEQTSALDTLALDAGGTLWQEDVINNPGVLSAIYTGIVPGSFAKSDTFEGVEYIAFSNLVHGTDMPRQWTGSKFDRVSQVGPAVAPSFSTTATGSAVSSITQNSPIVLHVSSHDFLLVSSGPGATGSFGNPATPGNVMTIIVNAAITEPSYFKAGGNIQLSGFPSINGFTVNNDPTGVTNPAFYTIIAVGTAVTGQLSYDWISFQVPFTTFYNAMTPNGCQVQATIATMTTAQQVPFLEVGNQFTLTGVTPSGWNNTFTVQQTPNAAVLSISQTQLQGNVATYTYTLVSGALPVVGEFVTVNGTLNGNGVFNVVNAVITSVSANTFSISIVGANIQPAPESNANASIYGTIFVFDPAGVVTNPIIGNGTGGSIETSGVIGVGTRQAVVIFLTENSALTQPSPYAQFNVTAAASAIVATGIPIGPPNVIARVIAFTGAGGSNYFWIPQPVTVISNGQQVTYGATIINDNTTTQATFSFPDQILLDATAIDVQGNNLFAQFELGACRGFLDYADRLMAWGVQNKIQNLLNLSFDGGIAVQNLQQQSVQPTVTTFPAGWTVDVVNGAGGSVLVSPLFGNSYYVRNASGGLQAFYGMITQPAYVNQLGTPIVNANTTYSARVTARCPSGVQTGNLVVDFFSPVLNQIFGSFTIPLSSMSTNFQIFTGTVLTAPFTKVPKDLLYRIYTTNIPNGGDVELDRTEPFPTLQPEFSTSFVSSYAFNQEAFDLTTGVFGPDRNQQRCNGGMVLFDTLYMLKENSWFSTSDNGVTEPSKWTWKTVSDTVGTIGSNSFDYGEAWAVSACRAGLYFFEGGEPIKISQEIQTLWDMINWSAGASIWVRNDEATKSIKIGVPITTPNVYMPEFPANANPTTPNVVLSMSYRELNTGMALASTGPVKTTFSGRLLSPEPARKWSFWNIRAPYADAINRGNNSTSFFLCSGYSDSKIFQLSTAQLSDDGNAINSFYVTHGMPKPEIAEARGIDVLRSQFNYMLLNVYGSGNAAVQVYEEDPRAVLPFLLDTFSLNAVPQGDEEVAVNLKGQRHFVRVGTNAVGSAFGLSSIVGVFTPDPWAAIRGTGVAALQ